MSEEAENPRAVSGGNSVAPAELRSFLERVERLQEEMAGLRGDVKDIFAEAKGRGYDVKVMRELLRMRKADEAELQEHRAILETYGQALGMGIFG
jgi:uncharacterized protein (UPF0335 family)